MRFLIVDGTSLAYRSYYAFKNNPLINSKGIKTSSPYGFTRSLMKMLKSIEPTHLAVVFDAKGKTFRHEMYLEYKAQRPKAPPDFEPQLSYIKKILDGMNIRCLEIPGVEADDVIASLCKMAESEGFEVYIATLDKDLYQLVSDKVKILDTREGDVVVVGREDVEKKFGVPPELIRDFLALKGDTIDNIPGMPGIGEQTAIEVVKKYGSIEKVLESESSEEIVLRIKQHKDLVLSSLELVKLRSDLELKTSLSDFAVREWNRDQLSRVFRELQFYSLLNEIAEEREVEETVVDYIPMNLLNAEVISVEPYEGFLYMSTGDGLVYKVPSTLGKSFLNKFRGRIVTFESKELYRELGEDLRLVDFDILIGSFLLDSDKPKFDPEIIFLEVPGVRLSERKDKRCSQICNHNVKAFEVLKREIEQYGLSDLMNKIELPFQRVLSHMEKAGIRIDIGKLEELSKKMDLQLKEMEQRIYEIAGLKFNINSPKQLAEVLFDKHKLKPIKKTKTGYSTDEETLVKLSEYHPLPSAILEYRQVFKLKSTYIEVFQRLVDPNTGRIYPTYNQVGAATGRISCLNPNFQTIPIRSALGKEIRDMIIAKDGYKILCADYSQVELRILAHFSQDPKLIEVFNKGLDVHSITASYIFGKPLEEITDAERRKAKTVNFGIVYGISPYGLSKELDITVDEGARFINNFFATYPNVMRWIDENLEFAVKNGFVKTLFGRIRFVPHLRSGDTNIVEQGKRIAINTPIQGTAADIIKLSMVEIYDELKARGFDSAIILQVHDEILMEVKEAEINSVLEIVKKKMEGVVELMVPLKIDARVGDSWLKASN